MGDRTFHFLVRVDGSIETYLFQVLASSQRAAERQTLGIPHLREWRLISEDELAEFLKNEHNSNEHN